MLEFSSVSILWDACKFVRLCQIRMSCTYFHNLEVEPNLSFFRLYSPCHTACSCSWWTTRVCLLFIFERAILTKFWFFFCQAESTVLITWLSWHCWLASRLDSFYSNQIFVNHDHSVKVCISFDYYFLFSPLDFLSDLSLRLFSRFLFSPRFPPSCSPLLSPLLSPCLRAIFEFCLLLHCPNIKIDTGPLASWLELIRFVYSQQIHATKKLIWVAIFHRWYGTRLLNISPSWGGLVFHSRHLRFGPSSTRWQMISSWWSTVDSACIDSFYSFFHLRCTCKLQLLSLISNFSFANRSASLLAKYRPLYSATITGQLYVPDTRRSAKRKTAQLAYMVWAFHFCCSWK